MELVRLTHQNAHEYIGYEILFKTRGIHIVKRILGVNSTSIKIEHHDLHNQIVFGRKVFVLIE